MRKKMFLAVAALVASLAVGVGTTLALFSDSVTGDNDLLAGKLCLSSDRNDGEPVPGPMFYVTAAQGATSAPPFMDGQLPTGYWSPGDLHERTLTVFNPLTCSSLHAWLTKVSATLKPGSDPMMADKLWVEVWTPSGPGPDVKVAEGWMSQFLAGPVPMTYPGGVKIPVFLTGNRHMKFKVNFDLSADNSYQDRTLIVDFTVYGEQMKNNP